MALKRYHAVQKVFSEVEDDQYDFHGYSLRRFTLNVYIDLLPWEDQLRSHPSYVSSAIAAAEIYIRVHDDPSIATKSSTSHLTGAEKKAKKKAKKAAVKSREEASRKTPPTSTNDDKGLEPAPTKDEDPDGMKLLQSQDPLERAAKFLAPLCLLAKDNVDAWIAIYDVAIRRKKYLQAVRALTHAKALDGDHPGLHVRLVDLRKNVSSLPQTPPSPIGPVLTSILAKLLPDGLPLETFNSQYLQQHSTSGKAILASAKVLSLLGSPLEEIESTVFGVLNPETQLDTNTAQDVRTFLKDLKSTREEEFRIAFEKKFELSTVFKTQEEIVALRRKAFAHVDEKKDEDNDEVEVAS